MREGMPEKSLKEIEAELAKRKLEDGTRKKFEAMLSLIESGSATGTGFGKSIADSADYDSDLGSLASRLQDIADAKKK